MSQIEELQSRITAAMDRIGVGVTALGSAQDDRALEAMTGQLDEEKLAYAQLEERVSKIGRAHV